MIRWLPSCVMPNSVCQVLFTSNVTLLESAALAWPEWLSMTLAALIVFATVELVKAWASSRSRHAWSNPLGVTRGVAC
jgi:hypothetical protein